ncbi:tetratricopeptide repeat protein [Streptomyces sp. NPDC050997]|uniref:tetratricopeptide repeat protein n=1 Tax=Streptomyces sp. NPDC050997 TaxID=3155519 RepID=UPI0034481C90
MHNEIKGGTYFNTVIQGQNVTIELPSAIIPALSGLPRRSSTFSGREQEINEVINKLAPSGSSEDSIVAITGMAGVGKTELALQVTHRVTRELGWFPGGALFIDPMGYDRDRRIEPSEALGSLLNSLGVPNESIPEETQDRARLYRSALTAYAQRGHRILIVIDNVDSADQASLLLPSDGINAALVTSRHTLSLGAPICDLEILSPEDSTNLIRSVVQKIRGDRDSRVDQEPEETFRLAELCGRLPLALQIAAALLADSTGRPVRDLAGELVDSHSRLDTLEREDRTVRAVFDLSYRNLPDDHASAFRLLPINTGPDVSTQAISNLIGREPRETGRLLEFLARAHLIESSNKWGRWRMHDLLRLYADEKGVSNKEADGRSEAIRRLINYYANTSEKADWILRDRASKAEVRRFRDRNGEASEWFQDEEFNLISTTSLAEQEGLFDGAYQISMNLGLYLDLRRRVTDTVKVATAALRAARKAKNVDWQARSLSHVGLTLSSIGRFNEAIPMLQEGIILARKAQNVDTECDLLIALGMALRSVNGPDSGIAALKRALAIGEATKNPLITGTALTNLGSLHRESGRFIEAAEAYARSIDYHNLSGDRRKQASGHSGLAATLSQMGKIKESIPHFKKAIEIYQKLGDRHGLAIALMNLGNARMRAGEFQDARDILNRSRNYYQESNDRRGESMVLLNLSVLERDAGNLTQSRAYHSMAQELLRGQELS